jgi:hypothetical protein
MTRKPKAYESYPLSSVLVYNMVLLINYLAGIYIMARVHYFSGIGFALYVILMEYKTYREGCVNCWYYGKRCFSGRGLLVKRFLKKGDPKKFCEKKVTAKDLVPLVLVLVFPTIGAAWLLWMNFEWLILGLVAIPWIIWFIGNPLIYGKLACLHCRQGRKCCPANDFFGKKVEKS